MDVLSRILKPKWTAYFHPFGPSSLTLDRPFYTERIELAEIQGIGHYSFNINFIKFIMFDFCVI